MKFGCCVNMLPGAETLAGIAYARPLKELGYDYIELPMSRLAALEERDFETVRDTLADLDLPCGPATISCPRGSRLWGRRPPRRRSWRPIWPGL